MVELRRVAVWTALLVMACGKPSSDDGGEASSAATSSTTDAGDGDGDGDGEGDGDGDGPHHQLCYPDCEDCDLECCSPLRCWADAGEWCCDEMEACGQTAADPLQCGYFLECLEAAGVGASAAACAEQAGLDAIPWELMGCAAGEKIRFCFWCSACVKDFCQTEKLECDSTHGVLSTDPDTTRCECLIINADFWTLPQALALCELAEPPPELYACIEANCGGGGVCGVE